MGEEDEVEIPEERLESGEQRYKSEYDYGSDDAKRYFSQDGSVAERCSSHRSDTYSDEQERGSDEDVHEPSNVDEVRFLIARCFFEFATTHDERAYVFVAIERFARFER